MRLASVKNCNHFFTSRPPTVIFFFCILIMMLTTFYFTFYVKYTDKIVNSDVRKNWISLTRHLNQMNLCSVNSTDNITYEDEISFVTLLTLDLNQFANVTRVEAYYNLEGWHPYCSGTVKNSTFLNVQFDIPQNLNETNVCAIIKGPKKYLPDDSAQLCDLNDEVGDNTTVILSSHTDSCPNRTQLFFDPEDEFETYLSQSDKNVIYVRLVWISYILLFFILIMLIYAMFYQTDNSLQHSRFV